MAIHVFWKLEWISIPCEDNKEIKAIDKRVSSIWKECEMFSLYLALGFGAMITAAWSSEFWKHLCPRCIRLLCFVAMEKSRVPNWTRFQTFMILDSLVNHIPRALAEYSSLWGSRRTVRLADLRTQTFFESLVFRQPPKCAENNRKPFYWH